MQNQAQIVRRVAEEVFKEKGDKVEYLVGTMIELPRAALVANEIAKEADFFSFGTNDLTQTKQGIFKQDPFAVLDQEGVGQLVQMATQKGRSTKSNLKVGICGEHGGEPESVKFCHRTGLNYVSCSPFRVLTARLAAAQAALEEQGMAAGQTK
jgi:pyruvate,orthophosphate dikinase